MAWNTLILEKKDNRIAELRLNRPKSLNALNDDVFLELYQLLSELEQDKSIRVLILTGEGRAFAAGADIGFMKDKSAIEIGDLVRISLEAFRKLERMDIVSIAAVNGMALGGGCELALSCDLRIASQKAVFGLPETSLGVIPGSGGTQRLTRLVGASKAKEIILTGDQLNAEEALRIGLINQVAEPDALMDSAYKMAEKILKKGPIAVRHAKKAIGTGSQVDIDTALELEMGLFRLCFASSDQKEGMQAFFDKRSPDFKDA